MWRAVAIMRHLLYSIVVMELIRSKELRRLGAITSLGAVLLSGCGGEAKTQALGEFGINLRVQRFHPGDSNRFYTEIVQQCDGLTLVETTLDIGRKERDGKIKHQADVTIQTYSQHRFCEDGTLTPEDLTNTSRSSDDGHTT